MLVWGKEEGRGVRMESAVGWAEVAGQEWWVDKSWGRWDWRVVGHGTCNVALPATKWEGRFGTRLRV